MHVNYTNDQKEMESVVSSRQEGLQSTMEQKLDGNFDDIVHPFDI